MQDLVVQEVVEHRPGHAIGSSRHENAGSGDAVRTAVAQAFQKCVETYRILL